MTLSQFLKRVHFQGKVWTTKPKKLWKQQGDTDRNILFVPLTLSGYSEFVLNQTQVEISLFPASSQKGLSLIVLRSTSHCNPSLFPSSRFLHPQLGETRLVLSPIALPILLAHPFTPLVRAYVDELDLVSFILIRYRSQRCTSSSRFIRLDNRYVFWSSLLRTNGIAQQYFHCSGNGRKLNNFTWSLSTGLNFSFLRYKYFFSTITCKKHMHVFPITICKNIQICFLNYNLQKKHTNKFSQFALYQVGNLHIQTFCNLPLLSHFLSIVLKANCIFWNTNSFHFSEQGSGSTKGDQIDDAFL